MESNATLSFDFNKHYCQRPPHPHPHHHNPYSSSINATIKPTTKAYLGSRFSAILPRPLHTKLTINVV